MTLIVEDPYREIMELAAEVSSLSPQESPGEASVEGVPMPGAKEPKS